ncbi:MAG: IPT/TIG domain-containing protein, partial [Planctomycetes bacterium]|nr:IPT/TIG domain-containing protein [Planctomycetota bacterium]
MSGSLRTFTLCLFVVSVISAAGRFCPAASLSGVTPRYVSTAGGTPITVTGEGFVARHSIRVGGRSATDLVLVDSRTITARTPSLRAGLHSVELINPLSGLPEDILRDAVEAVDSPVLGYVMPYLVATGGGDRVAYRGGLFLDSYTPVLLAPGIIPVIVPLTGVSFVDPTRIDG